MKLDSAGLEILTREDCLDLLASVPIGRIVFTDRALPAVQPVNFRMDRESIVIRAAAGSKLAAAAAGSVVAFEADDLNVDLESGWSVTAVGYARCVHDPGEIARLSLLPLRPWAPGKRDDFVVITPTQLSGRRIPPPIGVPAFTG
ncbi:pyridoxamine 5'-phosphate oxidase family protein [Rhizohabitans arisaemae]|uniref:pyridoxamine 5'-phosphate oxidase family protein n=1 Tax=Rhizohabitans arisaemae TaxID=2720610 RepID=UPI0024B0678E|nr:pyridoxamine 5'-phosphate oxidase family protein [Rhizohabitans arisaemae]